jgi:photosystem II stability/assembly factor-like uncharacterized protein
MKKMILFSLLCFSSFYVQAQVRGSNAGPPQTRGQSAQTNPNTPKFKAIWEPVNVKEDLQLMSVHFITPDEGWVAGGKNELNGGIILHTKDAGANWDVQLGDPQSSDRAYRQLSFLTSTLGWATQSTQGGDHNLLRTNDRMTWAPVGTVAQHRTDYRFISADVGFYTIDDAIFRTQDGGRRWQPVYRCAVKVEVNGLTRDVKCDLEKIEFMNASTGYAISREVARGAGFAFVKTTDGGATWSASVILPGEDGKEGALRFSSPSTGALRTIDGKLFYTADGGATWTGAAGKADGKPDIEFADKDIGWTIGYKTMTYTTNGGKSWTARQINFPANVNAFSLVQRDRGYAVGDHGMVYKYRIVPIDYMAKGMLPAPSM